MAHSNLRTVNGLLDDCQAIVSQSRSCSGLSADTYASWIARQSFLICCGQSVSTKLNRLTIIFLSTFCSCLWFNFCFRFITICYMVNIYSYYSKVQKPLLLPVRFARSIFTYFAQGSSQRQSYVNYHSIVRMRGHVKTWQSFPVHFMCYVIPSVRMVLQIICFPGCS